MKDNSKQVLLAVLGVAILVVAVIGVSFAAFSFAQEGTTVNQITTGTITMSYTEPEAGINLTNALPITDTAGKALTGTDNVFDFTVSATIAGSGNTTINYAITATKEADSTLPDSAVKVYLTDMDADADSQVLAPTKVSALSTTASHASGAPDGQYILSANTFTASDSLSYRLRMWVAEDYSDLGTAGTYKLKVNVYGAAAAQ